MAREPKAPASMRQCLDAAELNFDRAVSKACTDYELGLIKDRLTNLLKEIDV